MARKIRSKINNTYFTKIESPKIEISRNEEIIKKSSSLSIKVMERVKILQESREIRTKLYNLSKEIHRIEFQIADLFKEEI